MSLLSRLRGERPLRWSIVTSAPKGEAGEQWGDTWFARDLAAALERAGQRVRVVHRGAAEVPARDDDDVVLVLRGLRRVRPRRSSRTTWMLWVISHPELVEPDEPGEYDAVFAATTRRWRGATPLLQATNPHRFTPSARATDTGEPVLFVGSTRGEFRPIVRDAVAAGAAPAIYGIGWDGLVDANLVRGDFLPNDALPAAYASAGVVLNDHWPDMAAAGFLSNRLFDAVACGAVVISDEAEGMAEVLPSVRTYRSVPELHDLLSDPSRWPSAEERATAAAQVAREHSFDARAKVLVETARGLRS